MMRDPARIDKMIELLRAKWYEYPDMRLGQLVENMSNWGPDIFQIEDDEMERRLKEQGFPQRPPGNECPECGNHTVYAKWSGVECKHPGCGYWFCY